MAAGGMGFAVALSSPDARAAIIFGVFDVGYSYNCCSGYGVGTFTGAQFTANGNYHITQIYVGLQSYQGPTE